MQKTLCFICDEERDANPCGDFDICSDCCSKFEVCPEQPSSDPRPIIKHLESLLGHKVKVHGPLLETRNWWFVPNGVMGSMGTIVDKRDGNARLLGSVFGLYPYFLAYQHGFCWDLTDLTILQVYDLPKTIEFLARQAMWHNNREDVGPYNCPSNGSCENRIAAYEEWASRIHPEIRHWTANEIETKLSELPTCFRSQRLHASSFYENAESLPFRYSICRGT